MSRELLVGVATHVGEREGVCWWWCGVCHALERESSFQVAYTAGAVGRARGKKARAPGREEHNTPHRPREDPCPLAPQPTPTHTLVQFTLSLYSSSVRVPSALKPRSEAVSQPLMVAHCVCKGRAKVCQRERGDGARARTRRTAPPHSSRLPCPVPHRAVFDAQVPVRARPVFVFGGHDLEEALVVH